jgi:hypothetical protein
MCSIIPESRKLLPNGTPARRTKILSRRGGVERKERGNESSF